MYSFRIYSAKISVLLTLMVLLFAFFKPNPKDSSKKEYGYAQREKTKKGNLQLSSGFQNQFYTQDQNTGFYYVEIQADKFLQRGYERPPMNISVVIDRSGSMSGEKIRNAKRAAKHIVDMLKPSDLLSIVVYDDKVDLLVPQGRVRDKESLKRKIDGIHDRGSTNLMGGAMMGYEEVNKTFRPEYINRVLLLSDGLANEGITDPDRIRRIVRSKLREERIAISTFGVGADYNEDLMTAMAENGAGNYYFIKNAEDIVGIFKKELNGLMEVVAKGCLLQIRVPDGVRIEKVYSYAHEESGHQVMIHLNDIFSEETKGILIRYRIDRPQAEREIQFTSSLKYVDVETGRESKLGLENIQEYNEEERKYWSNFNEWVDAQVVLFVSNENMENAMKRIDEGDYDAGRAMVEQNKAYLQSNAAVISNSDELQAVELSTKEYEEKLENVENMAETERKVLQKSSKDKNYQYRSKKR